MKANMKVRVLALAIYKRIADIHGGKIAVSGKPGEGASLLLNFLPKKWNLLKDNR